MGNFRALLYILFKTLVIAFACVLPIVLIGSLCFDNDRGFKLLGFLGQFLAAASTFFGVAHAAYKYHQLEGWEQPIVEENPSYVFKNAYMYDSAYLSATSDMKRLIALEHKVLDLEQSKNSIRADLSHHKALFRRVFGWLTYLQDHAPLKEKYNMLTWAASSATITVLSAALGIWSAEAFIFSVELIGILKAWSLDINAHAHSIINNARMCF